MYICEGSMTELKLLDTLKLTTSLLRGRGVAHPIPSPHDVFSSCQCPKQELKTSIALWVLLGQCLPTICRLKRRRIFRGI